MDKSSVEEKKGICGSRGKLGGVCVNFFGMSNGRKNVENFIKKII